MFDHLKQAQALASLAKNKEKLKASAQKVKGELEVLRAEGDAGGGAVRVVVSGTMRVVKVHLEPALVAGMNADEQTRGLAGDLIAQATNHGMKRAQEMAKELIQRELRDSGIEGLDQLVGQDADLASLLG